MLRVGRTARTLVPLLLLSALVSFAPRAAAADRDTTSTTPRWGLAFTLGTGSATGFEDLFVAPISGEYEIFRQQGKWRYGFGFSFSSFDMKSPYDNYQEWGFQQTYFSATRVFPNTSRFQPYVTLRAGLARLHPRDTLFTSPDYVYDPEHSGDSPTKASNGVSVGLIPGVDIRLSRLLAIQASAAFTWFNVDQYDLSPVGKPNAGSGETFQGRLGLMWHPDPYGEKRAPAGPPARDAWGVEKSYGWAAGEVLAINFGAAGISEYVRNQNFCQISPRSWWYNLEQGFTWDDNQFKTNQYIHPWNGAAYFNSGRANGVGFWPSAGYALAGALMWEDAGETHPMSYNDMISTGIGGIAFGETIYRLSSEILDNQATGSGRTWREIAAFLVDPVRGFNRLMMGQATHATPNPVDPLDRRPTAGSMFVAGGWRVVGEGQSIQTDSTKSYGFLEFDQSFGDPYESTRRKPWDHFDVAAQANFGDKVGIGRFQIRGDLYSKALGGGAHPNHAFSIVQHFDYINNDFFEFGGQSFGAALFSRFRTASKVGFHTRLDGRLEVLSAVNADYSFLATDLGNQERYREYDYGPGLGGSLFAGMTVSGRDVLWGFYTADWITVRNGSLSYNGNSQGSEASHLVQSAGLRGVVPIHRDYCVGADATVFYRRSVYNSPELVDHDQRNPQARLYLAWNPRRI